MIAPGFLVICFFIKQPRPKAESTTYALCLAPYAFKLTNRSV